MSNGRGESESCGVVHLKMDSLGGEKLQSGYFLRFPVENEKARVASFERISLFQRRVRQTTFANRA